MRRKLLTAVSVIGVGLVLGGCSLLNPGPPRDSDGKVTESTVISARDLLDGDCFTFNSADGGVVAEVTVMPCSLNHEYLVIGQGTLTTGDVSSAGSLQNAVSVACAGTFDTFKSTVTGDTRPKQEFLVFPETDKPDSDQLYSCISTDPDQSAGAATPAP
jgi:hypothetical protein